METEVLEGAESKAVEDGRAAATHGTTAACASGSRAAKTLPRDPYEGDPEALLKLCDWVGSGDVEECRALMARGIGLDLRDKNQRPGRNPKTGEEIPISARRVVSFKPGQKMRARVESSIDANS